MIRLTYVPPEDVADQFASAEFEIEHEDGTIETFIRLIRVFALAAGFTQATIDLHIPNLDVTD